jgi:hypothetical protein
MTPEKSTLDIQKQKNATQPAPAVNQAASSDYPAGSSPVRPRKLFLFGAESLFIRRVRQTLSARFETVWGYDPEKASSSCLNAGVTHALIDMDEPTDWRLSTDVFTTVKTVNPAIRFYLFTSKAKSSPVQTLAARGCAVILKPVQFEGLFSQILR